MRERPVMFQRYECQEVFLWENNMFRRTRPHVEYDSRNRDVPFVKTQQFVLLGISLLAWLMFNKPKQPLKPNLLLGS